MAQFGSGDEAPVLDGDPCGDLGGVPRGSLGGGDPGGSLGGVEAGRGILSKSLVPACVVVEEACRFLVILELLG